MRNQNEHGVLVRCGWTLCTSDNRRKRERKTKETRRQKQFGVCVLCLYARVYIYARPHRGKKRAPFWLQSHSSGSLASLLAYIYIYTRYSTYLSIYRHTHTHTMQYILEYLTRFMRNMRRGMHMALRRHRNEGSRNEKKNTHANSYRELRAERWLFFVFLSEMHIAIFWMWGLPLSSVLCFFFFLQCGISSTEAHRIASLQTREHKRECECLISAGASKCADQRYTSVVDCIQYPTEKPKWMHFSLC